MYHQSHMGPLGQHSGVDSISGRGLHTVCTMSICGERRPLDQLMRRSNQWRLTLVTSGRAFSQALA